MIMTASEDDEKRTPFSEDALRHIAKEKVVWALGVKLHALAFVCANIFLIVLNRTIAAPDSWWSLYVLSSWTVGMGVHISAYLIFSRGVIGGNKKGLIMSVITELLSIQAVIVINILSSSGVWWFVWPVGAAILAMIVHAIVYMTFLREKAAPTGERKSWMERKVDEELKKVQRKK